ncbi:hypothetical protein [Sinobaca qinghaiensis]|nr:hypothetical protein [Sinobaca qinghaiensis]
MSLPALIAAVNCMSLLFFSIIVSRPSRSMAAVVYSLRTRDNLI